MRRCVWLVAVLALCVAATMGKTVKRDVIGYFWVPDNDTSPYWTMADHSDAFTCVAPTWLSFDKTGALTVKADKRAMRFFRSRGLKVTPLVANSPFKPEIARPIFENAEAVKKNVALLLKAVEDLGADGINLDIEGIAPADRQLYNVFAVAIVKAFHEKGLIVTADLPAKTSDAPNSVWGGWADYPFLAKHFDQLQLMVYDEHWSAGSPGPIASIPFVRAVLDYAVTVIPKEKIVLGMPFYGYDWPEKGTASEVTAVKSQEMLKSLNIKPQWDSQAQSYWFKYETPEGGKRTVYYESARTLKTRLDIAREYGIAGVSIWRVGDETPDFFPPLKKYRDGK